MLFRSNAPASLDNITKRHCFAVACREVRQYTGSESNLLLQVALREAEMAQLQLRRRMRVEIWVHNTQWVEFRDMVASYLICTDEELDLSNKVGQHNPKYTLGRQMDMVCQTLRCKNIAYHRDSFAGNGVRGGNHPSTVARAAF